MTLWLIEWLHAVAHVDTAVWQKITFRASLAALISFSLGIALGPRLIAWLGTRYREPNVSPSPDIERLHSGKQFTPTMGGLFIVAGVLGGSILLGDLRNPYLFSAIVLTTGMTLLGAVDDKIKLSGRSRGLSARRKLTGQIVLSGLVACYVYQFHQSAGALELALPGLGTVLHLGWWFIPLATLVLVASSNAVNLTDGLDGLAGGCMLFSVCGMAVLAYVAGHAELADYLGVTSIPGAGELVVVAAAVIGGLLGFLWFNCHPAQVFMGDAGSLPLGALLGLLAVVSRQEILLLLIGGVFVVEAASVLIQTASYRWRRRRVFLCAPLHHHFQFRGWPESRIVVRFWIASALCSIVGVASLRLQIEQPATGHDVAARESTAGAVKAPGGGMLATTTFDDPRVAQTPSPY